MIECPDHLALSKELPTASLVANFLYTETLHARNRILTEESKCRYYDAFTKLHNRREQEAQTRNPESNQKENKS